MDYDPKVSTHRGEEGQFAVPGTHSAGISLFHLDLHLAVPPWRWTPGWGVFLAALMVTDFGTLRGAWPRLLTLALISDAIWGAWWRMATTSPNGQEDAPIRLPYARGDGPLAHMSEWFPRGFFSSMLITVGLVLAAARLVDAQMLWVSVPAFVLAGLAWWLYRVHPRGLLLLEPLYAVGIPFLAGAYLFNGLTARIALLALAAVAGRWALRGTRWRRMAWALVTLAAWAAALTGSVAQVVVGGTLAVLLVTFLVESGPTTATDVAWLVVLGSQAVFK